MAKEDYTHSEFRPAQAQAQAGNDQITVPNEIIGLERRIAALENQRINLNTDIFGLFEVVSTVPTAAPRDLYDQIKIYSNSTTYRLYWYDSTSAAWHYATGT